MTASTRHQVQITADPALPTIAISREFDAPVAHVYRAHSEAHLFKQWIGKRDHLTRIDTFDCRTGGSWRFTAIDGDNEFGFFGSFHEVRPNERMVQTFTFEGVPNGVSLEIATFTDLSGGRSRIDGVSVFESIATRDGMIASGMEQGVVEGYLQLDELLGRIG